MNKYTAVMQTTIGGLAWHYDFTIHSDADALEYARRMAHELRSYDGFMGLTIFADTGTDNERVIGDVSPIQLSASDTMRVFVGRR